MFARPYARMIRKSTTGHCLIFCLLFVRARVIREGGFLPASWLPGGLGLLGDLRCEGLLRGPLEDGRAPGSRVPAALVADAGRARSLAQSG